MQRPDCSCSAAAAAGPLPGLAEVGRVDAERVELAVDLLPALTERSGDPSDVALVDPEQIIVDAKSGVTVAGRGPKSALMFAEVNENVYPYKVDGHQHVPEIVQALAARPKGAKASVTFVPHIVPINRGILSTIYLRLERPLSWEQIQQAYQASYQTAPFIRIRPQGQWPTVRDVEGTNYCDLAFAPEAAGRTLIICAAIDNLIKGAAGQAVQNLNVMAGWPETTGLA